MSAKTTRIIMLTGGVNQDSSGKIVEQIYKINEEDEREEDEKKNYKREPIKIIVSSYGGSSDSMFAIISAMLESKTPIYTHIPGYAMSAGAKIAMCGAPGHRTASEWSEIMIHDAYCRIEGKTVELNDEMGRVKDLNKKLIRLFTMYSKMSKGDVKELIKSGEDKYLNAYEALELGLIDKVLTFSSEN